MGRLVVEARGTAAEGPIVQGVAAVGNSDLAVTRGVDQGQTVCAVFVH